MSTTAALVVDIVDLPHQIGSVKDVRVETAAPADLGTDVIGVPEGSPVVLDAQLTSMEDGVLARGRADDNEETIRTLLQVYRNETAPLIEHYADRIITIPAEGTVEEINAATMAAWGK